MSRKRSQSLVELRRNRANGDQTDRGCNHMPTPEEIAEQCLEIQATWSPGEERSRVVFPNPHAELRQAHLTR